MSPEAKWIKIDESAIHDDAARELLNRNDRLRARRNGISTNPHQEILEGERGYLRVVSEGDRLVFSTFPEKSPTPRQMRELKNAAIEHKMELVGEYGQRERVLYTPDKIDAARATAVADDDYPPEERWPYLDELLNSAKEIADGNEYDEDVDIRRGGHGIPEEHVTGRRYNYWADVLLAEPITAADMRYYMEDPATTFSDFMKYSNDSQDLEVALDADMQTLHLTWTVDADVVDTDARERYDDQRFESSRGN